MSDSYSVSGHGSAADAQATPARTWSVLNLNKDGQPLIALVNSAYRVFPYKEQFPWCLLVSIPLRDPSSAGLASDIEGEALERFQQEHILPILNAHCSWHFVARTTHKGVRDLLFYIDSPEVVVPALNNLLTCGATRTFTFGSLHDENWHTVSGYLSGTEVRRKGWLPWRLDRSR
jgi:hypothetical protein